MGCQQLSERASQVRRTDPRADRIRSRSAPARDQPQLAELLAEVAFVKAENQRLVERFTDELKRLTERLVELEARAHRSWWARMFGSSGRGPEPARQPRRQAVARLRALCLDEEVEYRPT